MFIKIFLIYQLRRVINIRTIKHLSLSISFFFSHISLCFFRFFSLLTHCFFHVSLPPCIFLTDPFLITLFLSLSRFPFDSKPTLFSLSRFHLYWIYTFCSFVSPFSRLFSHLFNLFVLYTACFFFASSFFSPLCSITSARNS